MNFFRCRSKRLWGDYGAILINGMVTVTDENPDSPLELERTGPFVPPIMFPGRAEHVLVTDSFRKRVETSGLGSMTFRPVVKKRIVKLAWEQWDRSAEDPHRYPAGGEPEDYVLKRRHSADLAEQIGRIWQLVLQRGAVVDTDSQRKPWDYDIRVHLETWNGTHFFLGQKGRQGGWPIVSDQGRTWLQEHTGEWIEFEQCLTK